MISQWASKGRADVLFERHEIDVPMQYEDGHYYLRSFNDYAHLGDCR